MSDPTKVTSSTNVTDSWSTSIPASRLNDPAGTQLNRCRWAARSSPPRPSMAIQTTKPTTKAAHDMAVANSGPHLSVARPPNSSTAAPSSGRATSSHAYAVTPVAAAVAAVSDVVAAVARWAREVTWWLLLQLQQVGVVDRGRPAGTEDGHDDGQSHDDLGRGDHHDEQGDHLAVEVAAHPGERHEHQVGRVEHQLDPHEHDDRVAAHEDRSATDREQQGREVDVVDEVHRCDPSSISCSMSCSDSMCRAGATFCSRAVSTRETDSSLGLPSGSRAEVSTALLRA